MLKSCLALVLAFSCTLLGSGVARAADIDPLVPPDTQSYLAINLKAILEAPLFKSQLAGPLKDLLGETPEVKEIFSELGFDPMKHLHRLIFAMPGGTESDRGLMIAHGTFDEAKFKKRADDAARDNDENLKIHKVSLGGGVTRIVWEVSLPGQDTSIFVALASNKVMLASAGKDYVVDALKQHRAQKKATLANKEFQAVVEKLDSKQSVSMAVLGKSLADAAGDVLPQGVSDALGKIEVIGVGLTITNEVKLDLIVATKEARSAEAIRDTLDSGVKLGVIGLALLTEGRKDLSLLLEVVKTIKISGKGKVVAVSARLTADVLEDFFKKDD